MSQSFKKIGLWVAGSASVLGAFYLLVFPLPSIETARASAGDNVSGYAWSDTGGWISFNSSNAGVGDYGVSVDSSGNFSGYAWSDIVGWISFNTADVNASPDCGPVAKLDTATNKVSGWARVVSGITGAGEGKGCIRLSESLSPNPVYPGVTYDPVAKEFQGYAWEPDTLGWISFSCANGSPVCGVSTYKVSFASEFPIIESFSAASTTIGYNTETRLNWSTTNVAPGGSCIAAGDWSGIKSAGGGFEDTGLLTASKSYKLECFNSGGESTGTSTVNVTVLPPPPPSLVFYADDDTPVYGAPVVLWWNPQYVDDRCEATGDWSGNKTISGGSELVGAHTVDKTYYLECWNSGGVSTDLKKVEIKVEPPTCNDGFNNDGDGWFDDGDAGSGENIANADPDCYDETDTYVPTRSEGGNNRVCSNSTDDDGDGLVDDDDPGCHTDFDEENAESYDKFGASENTCNVDTDFTDPLDPKKQCDPGETFGLCPVDCADQFKYIEL